MIIILLFSKKRRKNTTGLLPRKHVKEVQHPCKPALSKNISHCTIITKKSCPIATKKKKQKSCPRNILKERQMASKSGFFFFPWIIGTSQKCTANPLLSSSTHDDNSYKVKM
jgi:hypothetical protein